MKKKEFRNLTGTEKAAIFILSLDDDRAMKILSMLREDEIQVISQAMASMGPVSSDIVQEVFVDFSNRIASAGAVVGSVDKTEKFLSKVLSGEKLEVLMRDIHGPVGKNIWDKISHINEEVLANYLKNENSQAISVILSKIKPENAAKVLKLLPEDLVKDVITRMLSIDSFPKEILEDVEQTLRSEFMTNYADMSANNNYSVMAKIFNYFEKEYEEKMFTALENIDSEATAKVKKLMFRFDDIEKIPRQGIEILSKRIDRDALPMALKGASDSLKQKFFDCMSQRALKLMKEEMDNMGPVRVKDVEEAQNGILEIAKQLIDSGEIFMAGTGGDTFIE